MLDPAIIEKEALQMTEAQRALLADRLLKSISPVSEDRQRAWVREADSRMQAFEEGKIDAIDGDVAMKALREKFNR